MTQLTSDLPRGAMVLLVTLVVVLFTGLVAGAFLSGIGVADDTHFSWDPVPGTEETISFAIDEPPDDTTVSPTTGWAVAFDGSEDSYASWSVPSDVADGPWAVCVWAEIADGANLDAAYDVLSVANGSIQLEYDAGNWLVYYDNGSHDAAVRGPATSPTDPSTPCGRWTGSQLEVWTGGSLAASSGLSMGPASRNVSVALNGTVDEIRISNSSVSSSLISGYASTPAIPWDGTQPVSRLMFDEGSGTTARQFYQSSDAMLNNASWTQGVARRDLTEGTDYDWTTEPWGVTPLVSGFLDDAPIAHVYYSGGGTPLGGPMKQIGDLASVALVIFGVALLAIPAVAVVAYMLGSDVGGLMQTR